MRCAVGGAFLVASDITVLLALVRLVSALVHDACAVGTKEYAGEQAHFVITVGAFAELLHPFPRFPVNDRLMVVLKNRLLFRGIFYAVFQLVGRLLGLKVYQTARIFPVFQMNHGIGRPLALIAGVVAASLPVLRYSSVPGVGICRSVSIRAILVGPFPARQRL